MRPLAACWPGVLLLFLALSGAEARLKKEDLTPIGEDGEVIPEVNGKKLESLLETEEYLAVFFCEYQSHGASSQVDLIGFFFL